MKTKKVLCFLAACTMFLPFSACGVKQNNKYGITPPDLKSKYVESGFVEYYDIIVLGDEGPKDPNEISVGCAVAYRLKRVANGEEKGVEAELFFGGGKEDPRVTEARVSIVSDDKEIGVIRTIPAEEFWSEDFAYHVEQTYYYDDEGLYLYYTLATTFFHSEKVIVPMSAFSEEEGWVKFVVTPYSGEEECSYTDVERLYYRKEGGKIHFMSEREYYYVNEGQLLRPYM